MFDHLALQTADVTASAAFYTQVFASLNLSEAMRFERPEGMVIGLSGPDGFPHLWLGPLVDPGVRPAHLALTAPSQQAVNAVHEAAQHVATEILHPPRLWPEYHPGYYSVFLRDLDGNNSEAVHHDFTTS